jgi:Ulp1 family protease
MVEYKQIIRFYKKGAVTMFEEDEVISTDDISEFFYHKLIEKGYVPVRKEMQDIADIAFEYLVGLGVIIEED